MARKATSQGITTAEPDTPVDVSGEELKALNAGPAIYSNKMYVTLSQDGIRLTFAELQGDEATPVYRTAVFLSYRGAVSLRDLLNRQISKLETVPVEALKKLVDGDET